MPIKTILVSTDFSENARSVLAYAVDLARTVGAKVVVVHAFELPILGLPDGVAVATAEIASRITNAAQQALNEAIEPYRDANVEIRALLKEGDPRETVSAVAKELGADLIVMGTHGRRGIARALIGSVAEYTVRTSTVPVLTIRGK